MRFVMFCHSLISDWNHGNAHFLRGIASELLARGHTVDVYEPADAWSVENLVRECGPEAVHAYQGTYPQLRSIRYDLRTLDVAMALDGADVVLVHEWNEPELVAAVGAQRAAGGTFRLLFHDTHHRAVTAPEEMVRYDLRHYDGVLAFGAVIRDVYVTAGWAARAWTWHEAADTRVFRPLPAERDEGDLVWIGNWGDGERTDELQSMLIEPVHALGLRARIHGVRYPENALMMLRAAGIEYGGWLPNHEVPRVFAAHRLTVHVPRRPYVERLPGIPTIRVFEALACGIPLVSAWWDDAESLFTPGADYLVARNGGEMRSHMRTLLNDPHAADRLAAHGLRTVTARHTCSHRVDELLAIVGQLNGTAAEMAAPIPN